MIGTRRILGTLVPVCMAAILVSGCTQVKRVIGVEKQLEEARATGRIEGRIETSGPADGTLVVLLARPAKSAEEGPTGVDTFVRVEPGNFAFAVSPGRYQLGAYLDQNRNGLLDPDEPVLRLRNRQILDVKGRDVIRHDLTIPLDGRAVNLTKPVDILGLVERTPREQQQFSLWALSVQGEICENLDDDKFGPNTGLRGLWEMMDFLSAGIAGVYFLEPYDPHRIPVLFVHGISGYPQQFSTLFDELDRERFQPWFYYYPSGFGLEGISRHLATILERLHVKHGFSEMAIVAHSMGGLVSRGAIFKYQEETRRDDIGLFISISTPWGGDVKAARAGGAPFELPLSFRDMNPEGDYIGSVFYEDEDRETERHLPDEVEYHMIFGFRMSGSNDVAADGTVTVASQARLQVQEEARTIRAFDYGHVDILHSPEMVARLNLLLERRFFD